MKKITLVLTLIFATLWNSNAQVGLNENFDATTTIPASLTQTGGFFVSAAQACAGNSIRKNLYSLSATCDLTSTNFAAQSNGTDLTVSFDYKIVEWSAATVATTAGWGTFEVQLSTDAGANFVTYYTVDDSNHIEANTCATISFIIPSTDLPQGSDVQIRFLGTWLSGDYYIYLDNISALQVTTTPPNCDAMMTTPTDAAADIAINTNLSWAAASGIATGYTLSVGTTPNGTDVVNAENVGNTTFYDLPNLAFATTYYVNIVPFNDNGPATGCSEHSFTTIPTPAPGNLCENAIVVESLPYTTTDNSSNYSDTYYEGTPGASGCGSTFSYLNGNDVVYSYTAANTGTIKVLVTPESTADTYMGFFVYNTCADIGVNCYNGVANSSSSNPFGIPEISVTAGETYYFVISTWAAPQTAAYTLAINENTCINASATFAVVADCANGDQFNVDVNITDLGSASSLSINNNQSSPEQIATTPGTYTFGPFPNNTPVTFTILNQQDANCSLVSAALNQTACPPTNDNFANATAIACGDALTGSTQLATIDEDTAPDGFGADLDAPNVWYSFTGSGTAQTVTLNLCGSDYDSSVLVYTGASGNLSLVVGNDDAGTTTCPGFGTRSYVSFNSDGVSTYYITIEGYNATSVGAYAMDVTCTDVTPPAVENQTCELALALPVDGTTIDSDNSFGDVAAVQPSCDTFGTIQDVWFSFVAPVGGIVDCLVSNGSITSFNFNIYSGDCTALTPVALTCNSNLTAPTTESLTGLVEGSTYFVQVWSNSTEQGTFSIQMTDLGLGLTNAKLIDFTFYPNPVIDYLNLSYVSNISQVEIFNLLGQQVLSKKVNAPQGKIDMSSLNTGTYLVKVKSGDLIKTIKVIKE